jgi:hypothetical protein
MRRAWLGLAAAALLFAHAARAQEDLAGEWKSTENEFSGDPEIGEYEGLPINEAARRHGHTWSPSLWSVPEHQCIPHPSDYAPQFNHVRIWKDVDPVTQQVVAYHTNMSWMNTVRTIWMDGRPHPPPQALHTWEGFSTGKWDGDVLTVTTTHLKTGYQRRNGTPRSTHATLIEHFIRMGDVLTWVSITEDPAYLTEPYIKSRDFRLDPGYQVTLYPCSTDIEVVREEGKIPHYLTQNPDQYEYADKHGMPHEAADGGAATAYPEYQERIRALKAGR